MGNFNAYFKLKEMTPVKVFCALLVVESIAWFWRLPMAIALLFVLLSLAFLIWLLIHSWRLAQTNFALQLEKNQSADLINSLSEGIITYNQDFTITAMNGIAESLCGIRQAEVVGKIVTPEWASSSRFRIFTQIIFPSLAPTVVKKSVGTYPQVVDISFTDPQELYVEVTTAQVFDGAKNVIGFMKVIRDRSREVELLRSKSEFITVAAHQLRTPLAGIKWGVETLSEEGAGSMNDQQKQIAIQTLDVTERLVKTVDDLLDVSKLEEGKFGYKMEKADLVTLMQDTMQTFAQSAQQHNVKLLFFPPASQVPPLMMDASKIKLVLQNLIDNAIKYNVPNGEVRVRIALLQDKPFVQVSVEDTGAGMDDEDVSRLFVKFYRTEETLKKETVGSGLGLYIAKNIIKRHGGDIWATSVKQRGSVFSFVLPTDESLIPPVEVGVEDIF